MKKIIVFLLAAALLVSHAAAIEPLSGGDITIDAPYAILIERETGQIIYEKDSCQRRSPASVTKVMTLLIIMDEIASGALSLDDKVSVSARAASMGGSQIWLKEGETMSVHDMIKCITVVSANDCYGRAYCRNRGVLRCADERARRRTRLREHKFHLLQRTS